jgi:hypothetical protein
VRVGGQVRGITVPSRLCSCVAMAVTLTDRFSIDGVVTRRSICFSSFDIFTKGNKNQGACQFW